MSVAVGTIVLVIVLAVLTKVPTPAITEVVIIVEIAAVTKLTMVSLTATSLMMR